MYNEVCAFIRTIYPDRDFIPLHEPRFIGREKEYVTDAIDSTFVSSVGAYVTRFEEMICDYTGAGHAVATVNGTAALHMALLVAGVKPGDEVICQPLSFVATANAIRYCGAEPLFLDVDRETMGLSPTAVEEFLADNSTQKDGRCYNRKTGRPIRACVPMHTFGHPCRIDALTEICQRFRLSLIEDAAESLGSLYQDRHTGTFGDLAIFSFNGNKTITCGGGGVIITDNEALATKAKHLTTTAKVPHPYLYEHDELGYNYRLPNLNAALACAQLENLEFFVDNKRKLAAHYADFFESQPLAFITEPAGARSNYWLNTLLTTNIAERDHFLQSTNAAGIMTRPAWNLLHTLKMYSTCQTGELTNARWLADRLVNIPSSVPQ
ncbi:MAG: LegC family aminotransferase [Proteobacteria bacterium]|nr:LegC family aminotransferase [Pseudomonadota bacterium]MBU1638963.1 LegC family aminotransferase [Pseudomonadota bacterium]